PELAEADAAVVLAERLAHALGAADAGLVGGRRHAGAARVLKPLAAGAAFALPVVDAGGSIAQRPCEVALGVQAREGEVVLLEEGIAGDVTEGGGAGPEHLARRRVARRGALLDAVGGVVLDAAVEGDVVPAEVVGRALLPRLAVRRDVVGARLLPRHGPRVGDAGVGHAGVRRSGVGRSLTWAGAG